MRAATCSVGLVSPRSTCESIGAETPERSARSLRDRSIASRRALMRLPMAGIGSAAVAIRLYVIAYRDELQLRWVGKLGSQPRGGDSGG